MTATIIQGPTMICTIGRGEENVGFMFDDEAVPEMEGKTLSRVLVSKNRFPS